MQHETYERKLKVYKSVQKHLSLISREGKATFQECLEFYSEASEAAFLFDNSVMEKIDEIYNNSITLVSLNEQLYPSDGSFGVEAGEDRSDLTHQRSELLSWHHDQLGKNKEFFAKKMSLNNK